jgi:hypothetical protein
LGTPGVLETVRDLLVQLNYMRNKHSGIGLQPRQVRISSVEGVTGGVYTGTQKLSFLGSLSTRCDVNPFATFEIDG